LLPRRAVAAFVVRVAFRAGLAFGAQQSERSSRNGPSYTACHLCQPSVTLVFRVLAESRLIHFNFPLAAVAAYDIVINRTYKQVNVEKPFEKRTLAMPRGLTRDFPQLQAPCEPGSPADRNRRYSGVRAPAADRIHDLRYARWRCEPVGQIRI